MQCLDILLYRYLTVYGHYLMDRVLAVLATLGPSQVGRPALQRVSMPVVPRASDVRLRRALLIPWM